MHPNSEKNRKLIKRYPFVTAVMQQKLKPLAVVGEPTRVDQLTIKVERADANLMYHYAETAGRGSDCLVTGVSGPKTKQVGKIAEYFMSVDAGNRIVNTLTWSEKSNETLGIFVQDVFWKDGWGTHDKVKYLVKLQLHVWHNRTDDPQKRFGDQFIERTAHVTIYTRPKIGFSKLRNEANLIENVLLHDVVDYAILHEDSHEFVHLSGRLNELAQRLCSEVYEDGLRDHFERTHFPAVQEIGPIQVKANTFLAAETCWFSDGKAEIAFSGEDGSPKYRPYVCHVRGRMPDVRKLVRDACVQWQLHKADILK